MPCASLWSVRQPPVLSWTAGWRQRRWPASATTLHAWLPCWTPRLTSLSWWVPEGPCCAVLRCCHADILQCGLCSAPLLDDDHDYGLIMWIDSPSPLIPPTMGPLLCCLKVVGLCLFMPACSKVLDALNETASNTSWLTIFCLQDSA